MDVNPNNAEHIHYAVSAGIGGALGYVYREVKAKRKLKLVMGIATCGVAAFIGYHMVYLFNAMELTDNWKGAINGVTALLGVEFMLAFVRKMIYKSFNIVPDKDLHDALLKSGWREPVSDTVGSSGSTATEGAKPE